MNATIVSKTCYFTKEELRSVQEIADREERAQAKIVQFAVRAFAHLYKTDPEKARQLAQAATR
jgi:hypothetical protein